MWLYFILRTIIGVIVCTLFSGIVSVWVPLNYDTNENILIIVSTALYLVATLCGFIACFIVLNRINDICDQKTRYIIAITHIYQLIIDILALIIVVISIVIFGFDLSKPLHKMLVADICVIGLARLEMILFYIWNCYTTNTNNTDNTYIPLWLPNSDSQSIAKDQFV